MFLGVFTEQSFIFIPDIQLLSLIHIYIIVAKDTNNDMMQQIRKAAGLIVEAEGTNSHAAIVGLSLDLPVILGAKHAVQILKTGVFVTLDGQRGTVSCNSRPE